MAEELTPAQYIKKLIELEETLIKLCSASPGFRAPIQDLELLYACETIANDEAMAPSYRHDKYDLLELLIEHGFHLSEDADMAYVREVKGEVIEALDNLGVISPDRGWE